MVLDTQALLPRCLRETAKYVTDHAKLAPSTFQYLHPQLPQLATQSPSIDLLSVMHDPILPLRLSHSLQRAFRNPADYLQRLTPSKTRNNWQHICQLDFARHGYQCKRTVSHCRDHPVARDE